MQEKDRIPMTREQREQEERYRFTHHNKAPEPKGKVKELYEKESND